MTASKRMALAFCCLLFALSLFGLRGIVINAVRYGPRTIWPVLQVLPAYLLFALPGWLLAMPFVLLFKDAEGRRMWLTLLIGTAIGPAFIGGWSLLATHGHSKLEADGAALLMSLTIGFLTTATYVFLLRHLGRRPYSGSR